jgi:hypothetical protein
MEKEVSNPVAFKLMRDQDVSGVSGTGIVAEGFVFTDGTVALRWRGDLASTAFYDSITDVEAIHGHEGATRIVPVMVDLPPWDSPPARVMFQLDIEKTDGTFVEIAEFPDQDAAFDEADGFLQLDYCTQVRQGDEVIRSYHAEPHAEEQIHARA